VNDDRSPNVRVLLFDLMDTVLADPYRAALSAATTVPLSELFARRDPDLWPAFERGELDEDAYWAGWDEAGIDFDRDAFHDARRSGTTFLPGMAELLDDLDGRVVRATASNYPVWVEEVARDHLEGRFEHVLASHHLGVRKPDPVFFHRVLAEVGAAPEEVRFIDDRQDNVVAAETVGIASHRFADAATLRYWLHAEGVPLPAGPR
jgi:FMN hydrolase / 5-amino-6-(5-phospho-D-ribitylamino)uracil phosphatase